MCHPVMAWTQDVISKQIEGKEIGEEEKGLKVNGMRR